MNPQSTNIYGYKIDPISGSLTSIGAPFPSATLAVRAAVDPADQFVYVANESGSVSVFRINQTNGRLDEIAGSPFPTPGSSAYAVTIDPIGHLLYALSNDTGRIFGFKIHRGNGSLEPVTGSPFAGGTNLAYGVIDPTQRFLYVADQGFGAGGLLGYEIAGSSGVINPIAGFPLLTSVGPDGVAIDPTYGEIFLRRQLGRKLSVGVFHQSGRRLRNCCGGISLCGRVGSYLVATDKTGQFVYVINSADNTIGAYKINVQTGVLTTVPGSPFAAGAGVDAIVIVTI